MPNEIIDYYILLRQNWNFRSVNMAAKNEWEMWFCDQKKKFLPTIVAELCILTFFKCKWEINTDFGRKLFREPSARPQSKWENIIKIESTSLGQYLEMNSD